MKLEGKVFEWRIYQEKRKAWKAVGKLKVNLKLYVCNNIILVCTVYLPGNYSLRGQDASDDKTVITKQ